MMEKLLFITTRNVLNTCGELRLIKNRAKALYNNWGIITDFIAVCSSEKFKSRNEEMGLESKVTTIVFKVSNPFSILKSFLNLKKEINEHLQTGIYKCVVLSGVGTLAYAKYIRKLNKNIKIIADIHGSDEDVLELAKGKSLFKWLRQRTIYTVTRWEEKRCLPKVDALFVVASGLVEYVQKEYHMKNPHCYVIPCALDDNILNPERIKEYRDFYRSKYEIEKEDILFVYSGGISPWQCIDKSIELFHDISKHSKKKCKMLFLSHKLDNAAPFISDSSDIIADKAAGDEVKRMMCAGDYAFLIREDIITNNVAYPNKFLEYVQSGMKIITTPFVYDVALQVRTYDLGIVLDINKDNKQVLYDYVTADHDNDYQHRIELLNNTSFEFTMSKFVEECYQG